MYCRKCGTLIDDDAVVCPSCGERQKDDTPNTVFCKHCGSSIDADCVICPKCGKQVKELQPSTPNIVINNANNNVNNNVNNNSGGYPGKACNKWTAFLLCFFLGGFGAHKFYEGKAGLGILYLFTFGLFGIGWLIDLISILLKPNPYYVPYR